MAMATMSAAIPLKIAPTTKYGPKIGLCHMGTSVIASVQDTTVCTETAMGMMATAMIEIAFSSRWCCSALPFHPRARSR